MSAVFGGILRTWAGDNAVLPPFKQLRYDEDYSYLREAARHPGAWDSLKFIPLTPDRNWYVTLGGEVRERYEYFNHSLWGRGPQDGDGYWLQRCMLHADAHLGDWFRVFAQFKSGLEEGRNGGPRPTDRDESDVNQAFFDLRLPLAAADSLTLRVGRQEMAYGSSRLVSFREDPNVRLAFDGVKVIWNNGGWQVDTFLVKPVRTKTGVFDDDPDPGQSFWGLYATAPVSWLTGGYVDLYYFGLDRQDSHFDQGMAHETRHTVGIRFWGRRVGWDYNLEGVYQFGTFGSGNIQAWTAAADLGYTFAHVWLKPRLGLKADVTSGDDNPNNRDLQTFNPLFPRGAYFGEPALIGPANHIDFHPSLTLALLRNVSLDLNWDCFWRESIRDGIYGPAMNLIQSGKTSDARFIGHQIEALAEWRVDRHWTVVADYARFIAGDFLKATTPGEDVDFFSAWITYRF